MKKTRSTEVVAFENRRMLDEHILRWLIEFGTDWVNSHTLTDSWADPAFFWHGAREEGLLEHKEGVVEKKPFNYSYKLTQKALDRLSNKVHEGELSYD